MHKFGGASVKTAAAIRNAIEILKEHTQGSRLVVVSAMDKTTNKLEAVARLSWAGRHEEARARLKACYEFHQLVAAELIENPEEDFRPLALWFDELNQVLGQAQHSYRDFDAWYDRIVHGGEVLSTRIFAAAAKQAGLPVRWHASTTLVSTDSTHREARVDLAETNRRIQDTIDSDGSIHIVQGFIGSDARGNPTTLGLEGSDYTAGIFAAALQAESVTLWKDVAGVFNADPKLHPEAVKLAELSYREVMEMANYGAKVIHPKTLKPLENAGIPLRVKSFAEPTAQGTNIGSKEPESYPPVIVHTDDLTLLTVRLKDLSYIHTQHVNRVFQLLQDYRARTYLTQIAFMHLSVALQLDADRLEPLVEDLQKIFELRYNEGLELITIRHYSDADIAGLCMGRTIYLEQRSRATTRLLIG